MNEDETIYLMMKMTERNFHAVTATAVTITSNNEGRVKVRYRSTQTKAWERTKDPLVFLKRGKGSITKMHFSEGCRMREKASTIASVLEGKVRLG